MLTAQGRTRPCSVAAASISRENIQDSSYSRSVIIHPSYSGRTRHGTILIEDLECLFPRNGLCLVRPNKIEGEAEVFTEQRNPQHGGADKANCNELVSGMWSNRIAANAMTVGYQTISSMLLFMGPSDALAHDESRRIYWRHNCAA